MFAKEYGKIRRSTADNSCNCDELETNAPVQPERPFDTQFHQCTDPESVRACDQHAAAADVKSAALTTDKLPFQSAVANLQVERKAQL